MIQKIIRWLPLFLLIFLFIIDRENIVHVATYIFVLLSYTGVLVLKILYAKDNWHKEFGNEKSGKDAALGNSRDLKIKMSEQAINEKVL